jgi:hypothetical protein
LGPTATLGPYSRGDLDPHWNADRPGSLASAPVEQARTVKAEAGSDLADDASAQRARDTLGENIAFNRHPQQRLPNALNVRTRATKPC